MRTIVGLTGFLVICLLPVANAAASNWEPVHPGNAQGRFLAVTVDPANPRRVLAATEQTLYESQDNGAHWEERYRLTGSADVTAIAVGRTEPAARLLATNSGLYGSFDGGTRWSRVFRGSDGLEKVCTYVAFHPEQQDTALLGTRGGLFISKDGGRHWKILNIPSAARAIAHLGFDPADSGRIYLVAEGGLFIGSLSTGEWTKSTTAFNAEDTEVEEPDHSTNETGEDDAALHRLSAIVADPKQSSTLYLASSRGLQVSQDRGSSWQWLTTSGMASSAILRLLVQHHSPPMIYAGTPNGVASLQPGLDHWQVLTEGLAITRVNDLAVSSRSLWAATDQGLFRYEIAPDALSHTEPTTPQDLLANFNYEPTIAQVQDAAVRYAEVHPDKIRRWRRQAALQALLPSVDVGFDHDRSRDTSIDEGSFPNFQLIKSEDRDASFDVGVTWDLGHLIWNDDQTNIDVRSKLMVQLRNDIVDEVTRTYYERRRLQVALLTQPPANAQVVLEKELRVQELTALIDGLTDGYFSKHTFAVPEPEPAAETGPNDNL